MDKKDILNNVVKSLRATHGQNVLQWLEDITEPPRLSTGLDELDDILRGGLYRGRIVEIIGLKQSGKTALACQLASQCEYVAYIDAERKMTQDFGSILHLPKDTIIVQPKSLEHALELTRDFILAGIDMVIIDSLPALPPIKQVEEKNFDKNTGFSPTAGLLSLKIPVFLHMLQESGAILVVVNQLRSEINAGPFAEKYHSFGGLALANYASLRLATARKSWLKHDKLGVYGTELAIMADKSNMSTPRSGVSLPLVYDIGIIPNDQLKETRTSLINQGKRTKQIVMPQSPVEIKQELDDLLGEVKS